MADRCSGSGARGFNVCSAPLWSVNNYDDDEKQKMMTNLKKKE